MNIRSNVMILCALLRKEVMLMRRNPLIPKIILVMPAMVMLFLPLVATMDVRNVKVAVVDNDRSQLSRRLMAGMDATEELEVVEVTGSHREALRLVERDLADVILTIPSDFERDMPSLCVEADGVNSVKGMLGSRYVAESLMTSLDRWRRDAGIISDLPDVTVSDRYNMTLSFRNYMIPALMVILLIIICGFLPTLNLVREKECGTIEAMNVTPVSRFTFVLSKLIPFWVIGILVVTTGMLIGWLVYGLRPEGSLGAIYLATVLFSLIISGLGVAVANRSATMLQSIFVMFACIMVFQLMGGLFTPIGSMPEWAQVMTYAVPPRYFNEIMRAVYLKGATINDLWAQYVCLAVIAVAVCAVAAWSYRKRV